MDAVGPTRLDKQKEALLRDILTSSETVPTSAEKLPIGMPLKGGRHRDDRGPPRARSLTFGCSWDLWLRTPLDGDLLP